MPHDVTMPQLGMAQDAGKIVSWLKAEGDPVAKGDALFEVETDKATMEVEAQAGGFLTQITAVAGQDVPVGAVIARISDSAEDTRPAAAPAPEPAADDALPEGRSVTMPQLGMAQDTGVLVSWQKSPGDAVAADDVLFEVETDKSTMEVPAGMDGYLAATLVKAGDEVPVGASVAIISAGKPDSTVSRGLAQKAPPVAAPSAKAGAPAQRQQIDAKAAPVSVPAQPVGRRLLVSPKARRLALERGLDLHRLVAAGHPQPFHVRDLDRLAALPSEGPATGTTAAPASIRLTAEVPDDGFADFARWAAKTHDLTDGDALLAGLAGASLDAPAIVAVQRHGQSRAYAVPADRSLSAVSLSEESPDLILRDLRGTALRSVVMGAESVPVLTVMSGREGLAVTLECSAAMMPATAAITLISAFADRMEQPLRHLL